MPASLKQRIGYVCQEPNFYPWMTADQLGGFVGSFYPKWDAPEFQRLLRLLDVPRDRRASEMSGGTRTKLGLALALAPRPELLLLDEPTAGLDPVARREFNDQLQALQRAQGTTVMFSSHLVGEVEQLAQRVGIVQAGRCCFEGEVGRPARERAPDRGRRLAGAGRGFHAPARRYLACRPGIVGQRRLAGRCRRRHAVAGRHLPRLRPHRQRPRLMHALLRKELREHRWVLLAMLLVLAICQASTLIAAKEMGSPMGAYQKLVVAIAPLMALVLANRLVVREYMGRTQLFLETLPVNRSQVLALKWLLGAALLVLAMAACLGVTLLAARGQVSLTPHYIALVAIRSASFIFLAYALAFAIGLTGRYRYVIWGVLAGSIIMADTAGQIATALWPPFLLVQESMVYERLQLPLRAVLITCGIAMALVAATFALALSAQGSLVVALSRRMTPREKSGVTIGILILMMAFGVIEMRKSKPAFKLRHAVHSADGPAVAVGIANGRSAAQELANLLSSDLARLQAFLALPQAPALAALPDDSLDGDAFQRAALPNADGVVVRAAFTNSQFDREGFRAYALAASMQWYSHGRAAMEEKRWLLDGAAQWLVARDLPQQQETLALRAAFAARLLQARQRDAGSAVRQWLTVREELGTCLSDALAWRMVSSLAQQMGEQRFQALSRTVLAARAPDDARASLFEPSFAQLLAQAGAPDQAALAEQFGRLFSAEQARLASTLAQIAMPQVSFTARPMEGRTYEVHYQVGKAAGDAAPFSVRYVTLGPWDSEIPPEVLARVDTTRAGVLPASFTRGTRLFTAIERREALLGCSVRLAALRWEVK